MNKSRYFVSAAVMSLYSIPVLIVLGLVGHWVAGPVGAAVAVGVFLIGLFRALLPKTRLVGTG